MPEKKRKLIKEVREKAVGYLLAGFGIVAGLAWNDAIKAFIDVAYPLGQESLIAKFVYAGIMTIIIVIVTAIFVRAAKESEK